MLSFYLFLPLATILSNHLAIQSRQLQHLYLFLNCETVHVLQYLNQRPYPSSVLVSIVPKSPASSQSNKLLFLLSHQTLAKLKGKRPSPQPKSLRNYLQFKFVIQRPSKLTGIPREIFLTCGSSQLLDISTLIILKINNNNSSQPSLSFIM